MAEGFVQVTEGAGKKLRTFERTVGANNVHSTAIVHDEAHLASFMATTAGTTGISTATVNSAVIELMAGASLNVYLRRIRIYQFQVATTAAIMGYDLVRCSTAGTAGTALTSLARDLGDTPSATVKTLPTPGTLTSTIDTRIAYMLQTIPTAVYFNPLQADFDYRDTRSKALIIPAGTSNGIIVRNRQAIAGATISIVIEWDEASF